MLESAIGDCFLRQGSEELALAVYAKFEKALLSLQRRFGGLRTQQIHQQLLTARDEFLAGKGLDANRAWIEALLVEYYDPIYLWSLDRRQPSVAFRGSADEVRNYLKTVFEK